MWPFSNPSLNATSSTADAWGYFLHLLRQLAVADYNESFPEENEALARYLLANPGRFEERLLDGIGELAETPCKHPHPSLLGLLLNQHQPNPVGMSVCRLEAFFQAVSPRSMLQFMVLARRDYLDALGRFAQSNSTRLALYFSRDWSADSLRTLGFQPEYLDALLCQRTGDALPPILPDHVASLKVTEINDRLETYCGVHIATLEQRMVPGAMSASGFLAPGERLAEVIHRDATTLAALGVSHRDIADRIDSVIEVYWHNQHLRSRPTAEQFERSRPYFERLERTFEQKRAHIEGILGPSCEPDGTYPLEWNLDLISCAGHQLDPFHSSDIYGLYHRGAAHFRLTHRDAGKADMLEGPDLITVLIRRACFFEGAVTNRVDPALAARFLGLRSTRFRTAHEADAS
jgi:hypothetical protein